MPNTTPILTIDGPSGSGKGAVSRVIAQKLGWHMLDSGAVYRVLAHAVLTANLDPTDISRIVSIARSLPVVFRNEAVYLDAADITHAIREELCGDIASKIAVSAEVRAALLQLQRSFAKLPGLVADGRDMGTVVFPEALLKIYLDATVEERAKRRFYQLKNAGFDVNLVDLEAQLVLRDERDKTRAVAPLKPAEDAIIVDTTRLSIDDVVNKILALAQQRGVTKP